MSRKGLYRAPIRLLTGLALIACMCVAGATAKAEPAAANGAVDSTGDAGKKVFDKWCESCHGSGYHGHPGTLALQAKYKGSEPAELEKRTDLDQDTIKAFVRHGVSIMAPFRKTEISDAELAELAQYLASPKSN